VFATKERKKEKKKERKKERNLPPPSEFKCLNLVKFKASRRTSQNGFLPSENNDANGLGHC